MIRPIHPFPARMAPDLAIASLKDLKSKSVVLDPMMGSGTVVRHASEFHHRAIGFDLDPLAVLMTRVWTTPIDYIRVAKLTNVVIKEARNLSGKIEIPWIDYDKETRRFVEYWFAEPQQGDLRRLAYVLTHLDQKRIKASKQAAADLLRLALSRIIITKDKGASLARDASHSRPHKVATKSNFEVFPAFERSVQQICRLLAGATPPGNADVKLGDARSLETISNSEVDAVLTSPPYLNAIDYMRGHRLSLVWLGHKLSDLRHIRSKSVGAERAPDHIETAYLFETIQNAMGPMDQLSHRHSQMVMRYAEDLYRIMSEIARVLKPQGRAILVVGNSCLKGIPIRNSDGVIKAASMVGLKLQQQMERPLPTQSRYLPMPSKRDEPLGKRIRTETILIFVPT